MQPCSWDSGCAPLHAARGLYLCERNTVRITCRIRDKELGKGVAGVSDRTLLEEVRLHAAPALKLTALRILQRTDEPADKILVEAEAHAEIERLVAGLSRIGKTLTLSSGRVALSVAAERVSPSCFPTRHQWDSFFRDAKDMDEMKPGERPDTVHLCGLPVAWFSEGGGGDGGPSEALVRKAMEKFGKVRSVDVPAADPHRDRMKRELAGLTRPRSELHFEAYVQYEEYSAFVRAMEAWRGRKLLKKEADGTCWSAVVAVDFDRSKHLSEASVRRREVVRERHRAKERKEAEKKKRELSAERKKRELERRKRDESERERLNGTREREKRRKERQLAKLKKSESVEMNSKIAEEKKKLVRTQRKLQSIRLIEKLFERIQQKDKLNVDGHKMISKNMSGDKKKFDDTKKKLRELEKALLSENKEKRHHLVSKYKSIQEKELEEQKQKLEEALEGNILLKSVFKDKDDCRTPSISSLSSGSDIEDKSGRKIKTEKSGNNQFLNKEDGVWLGPDAGAFLPYEMYPGYNNAQQSGYFPRYFSSQDSYNSRGRGFSRRSRGAPFPFRNKYRGFPRLPYFDGPNSNRSYLNYFKKLADRRSRSRSYSKNRSRSRSYSKSRSRRRSYSRSSSSRSRSRSRSRKRSSRYSRSRTHSRSRSRSRSRSSSRKRSKDYSSKHRSRTRSRSRRRSRSKARSRSRSRTKSPDKSNKSDNHEKTQKKITNPADFIPVSVVQVYLKETSNDKTNETNKDDVNTTRCRSRSWSLPKDSDKGKSWSKSPVS